MYGKTAASKRSRPPDSEISVAAMMEAILDHEAERRPSLIGVSNGMRSEHHAQNAKSAASATTAPIPQAVSVFTPGSIASRAGKRALATARG
jgi:hypothetical protein